MKSRRRRAIAAAVFLAASLVGTLAPANAVPKERVWFTGGWFNDLGCAPVIESWNDEMTQAQVSCVGTTTWNGDFTGKTTLTASGTMYAAGGFSGVYEEWFYGEYLPERIVGGLHMVGTVEIDTHLAFHAEAKIIGGTCGFADAKGWITFDGFETNGGYVGEWVRPKQGSSATVCQPVDTERAIGDLIPG